MLAIANFVLVLHALIAFSIVALVPLILIGKFCRWRWIRNRRLRLGHFFLMGFIAAESIVGILCPLTYLEDWLRHSSGREGYGQSFVAYWISNLLFYDFSPFVFTASYFVFAILIGLLYWRIPPRPRRCSLPT